MTRQAILALLIAFSFVFPADADPATRDIEAFVAKTITTIPEVPSIGVTIVRDGKPYARAFGYADVGKKKLADANTGYYIGSTTKAFTGLACAILAGQGKLDLDAPISKYLPEVKATVTLRKLLSHTSGIENVPIVFRTAFSGEHDPATLVALIDSSKPRANADFRYDNLGYVIAGLVLERVTGRTWQQLHDEMIFTPLGMNRSTAVMSEAQRRPLAEPYEFTRPGRLAAFAFRKTDARMHAAGGTVTTPRDLARWLEANLGLRQGVPAAAIAQTQQQQAEVKTERPFPAMGYGFGWYQGTFSGQRILFHGGGFEGWRALFSFMPEKKTGVAIVTNSGLGNPVTLLVSSYIYDRLLGKPDVEKIYAEKLATIRADFDKHAKQYVEELEMRAKRPSMLQHPLAAYAGRYEHPLYGAMTVSQRGDGLVASIGTLSATIEAYTKPECGRVELIPETGEVLQFVFAEGANTPSIRWRDELFVRKVAP